VRRECNEEVDVLAKAKQLKLDRILPNAWHVTFENPPLNLLDPDTIKELEELIVAIEADEELKVVLFESANPDYFIAHYDVSRAAETPREKRASGLPAWGDFTVRLAASPVVSIASVRGRARGVGSEFVLACDLCFASLERAIFCQPEVGVGLVPGGGAVERLPRVMGRARALEVLLGSDDFDAATAERYGWVNRAIPDWDLDRFVGAFVRRIASFDKQALTAVKQLVNRNSLPQKDDLLTSSNLFMQSLGWDGAKQRVAPLIERGLSKPGDFESRLGRDLAELMK
jgi:enoyl-CoA hydratase/carnithine racemase